MVSGRQHAGRVGGDAVWVGGLLRLPTARVMNAAERGRAVLEKGNLKKYWTLTFTLLSGGFRLYFYCFPVFPVESHFLCGIIFKYFVADICYLAIWDKKLT